MIEGYRAAPVTLGVVKRAVGGVVAAGGLDGGDVVNAYVAGEVDGEHAEAVDERAAVTPVLAQRLPVPEGRFEGVVVGAGDRDDTDRVPVGRAVERGDVWPGAWSGGQP